MSKREREDIRKYFSASKKARSGTGGKRHTRRRR
jgi:hypothetical protein